MTNTLTRGMIWGAVRGLQIAALGAVPYMVAAPAHAQVPTCNPQQRPCLPTDPTNAVVYLGRQGTWSIYGQTKHIASQTFDIYFVPDVPAAKVCRAEPCGTPMAVQWRRYQAACSIGRYFMVGMSGGAWNNPTGVNGNFQYSQAMAQNIPAANGDSIYDKTPMGIRATQVCIEEGLLGVTGFNPYDQPAAAPTASQTAAAAPAPHVAQVTVAPAK